MVIFTFQFTQQNNLETNHLIDFIFITKKILLIINYNIISYKIVSFINYNI